MSNIMLTPPPVLQGNTEKQLRQMYSYLYQMSEQLNVAINCIDGGEIIAVGTDISSKNSKDIEQKYDDLKSLIIKTADTTEKTITVIKNSLDETIHSIDVMYALSDSEINAPVDGWTTIAPKWINGKYMWQKTVITSADESKTESKPTCISGAIGKTGEKGDKGIPGDKGDKGAPGEKGNEGIGITDVTEQYAITTNKNTAPEETEWQDTCPTWNIGTYLWTRSKITYTNATIEYTTAICDTSWEAADDVAVSVNKDLEGIKTSITENYVARSQFGEYKEITSNLITEMSDGIAQNYNYWSELTSSVNKLNSAFDNYVVESQAYIKSGIVEYEGAVPIYGIAVGQNVSTTTVTINGKSEQEIQKVGFLATYTSKAMKFWQDNVLVAYMDGNKLHITNAEVENISITGKMQVGKFKITDSNGFCITYTG